MRLLAVAPVDHPGGAEIHLLRLVAGLLARGWETALTTPGRGPLRDRTLADGHGWQALPVGGLGRGTGWRALARWPRARRLARGWDVVYELPEVVEDGVTGALVEPGDVDALAAAVRRALERRDELGAADRTTARRFHMDAYVDRVEGLLRG